MTDFGPFELSDWNSHPGLRTTIDFDFRDELAYFENSSLRIACRFPDMSRGEEGIR